MKFWNYFKTHSKTIQSIFWVFFLPISVVWVFVAVVRRAFAEPITFKVASIGVGNIHSGGSGKTPLVAEIAEYFEEQNPIVISKGYGLGDEAKMLVQRLETPVYVAKSRTAALEDIEANELTSLVIFDDGFQDVTLQKDLELVLISDQKKLEESFCLPLGELREPLSALDRASGIVLVDPQPNSEWATYLSKHFPNTPQFPAKLRVEGVFDESGPVDLAPGNQIGVFSGIADPQRFLDSFGAAPYTLLGIFSDHHPYESPDLEKLLKDFRSQNLDVLVTTEKDYWKCVDFFKLNQAPLLYLRIGYDMGNDFWDFVKRGLQ